MTNPVAVPLATTVLAHVVRVLYTQSLLTLLTVRVVHRELPDEAVDVLLRLLHTKK